jgi:hypothetical protein
MNVEFIEPASIELDDAVKYYNLEAPGLGDKFFDEVLTYFMHNEFQYKAYI